METTNQLDSTISNLLALDTEIDLQSPPVKKSRSHNDQTLSSYLTRLQTEMSNMETALNDAISKLSNDKSDSPSCPGDSTLSNRDKPETNVPSFQGFADTSLPADVRGTWKQMRTDQVEGGKNKIRGEGLRDIAAMGHYEPWTFGLEKTPLYLSGDKEYVAKLVDMRRRHAHDILSFTAEYVAEKAEIQKKSAARAKISIENAIDEESTTPEMANKLKDDSKQSIDKIISREVEKEMRQFNEKANSLVDKQVIDSDISDICATVFKMQNRSQMGPGQPGPFREHAPFRGARNRGRGPRRGYRPYPPRSQRGGYQ